MRSPVIEEWQSYRREVVPADAPSVQIEECRRAFYAGALAGHTLLLEGVTTEELSRLGLPVLERLGKQLAELNAEIQSITKDLRIR